MKKFHQIVIIAILSLTFNGCDGGGGDSTPTETPTAPVAFSGTVQKGPFEAGTSIEVYELDEDLQQTGKSHRTNTTDDKGNYELPANLTSTYVEVFASGYYYDEITGAKSSAPYELSVITDITGNTKVNVNILTSLAKDRLRQLVTSGMSFSNANMQSGKEILKVFNMDDQNISLEDMDLTEANSAGSALLAASSIIMQVAHDADQNAISAELTSFLANIKTELKDNDGNISSNTITNAIRTSSMNLDIEDVKNNLKAKFSIDDIGDMEGFIDGDGDGKMGADEKTPTTINTTIGTPENTNYIGTLTGSDADGDTLSFSIVSQPTKGSITLSYDGNYTYTPNTNYIGQDSFTYKAFDGTTYSNVSTVTIHINNSPIFTSDSNITILDNTSDITTVVATDETAITYELSGDDASLFDFNSSTGLLTFKAQPDWDNPTDTDSDNIYELVVKATDTMANETIQNISVKVKKYRILGSYTMEDNATVADILVDGNYAYVTDLYNGLYIFNVTNPNNITLASFTQGTYFRKIKKIGSTLYIVSSDGLKVIDSSNVSSPTITATLNNTVKTYHAGFYIDSTNLFAIDTNQDMSIFDISDYNNISTTSTLGITENINNQTQLTYSNNFVFVAGKSVIESIDVSTLNNPSIVNTYTTNGGNNSVKSLLFTNDTLYSLTMYKLDIVDVSNTSSLSRLGEFDFSQQNYRFQYDIAINSNYIFSTAGGGNVAGGINIIDKSTIGTPKLVEEIDLESTPYQIDIDNSKAYIDDRTNKKFIILDISDRI
jgi:hypothetical protein